MVTTVVMIARNMTIAAMPCAFESNWFGKKISATRPRTMIARRRYIDTVPKTLLGTVVLVRRYIHHDTTRAMTRTNTTAHTLFVMACVML